MIPRDANHVVNRNNNSGAHTMIDEAEKTEAVEGEDNKAGGGKSIMKFVLAALLLLVFSGITVGVTLYLVGGDKEDSQAEAAEAEAGDDEEVAEREIDPDEPPTYTPMDPKFVVSFSDQKKARFMQFTLQVMTRDDEVVKQLRQHMPAVRSSLLMLVGSQQYERVVTREGKQELLAEITADINQTLDQVVGYSGVEAAYFDTFVIQ